MLRCTRAARKSISLPDVDTARLGGLGLRQTSIRKRKEVRFSNIDKVVLVPTRQEYVDHNLGSKLWWTVEDYSKFKRSAVLEVSAMINIYRIDAKTALERMSSDEYFENLDDTAESFSSPQLELSLSEFCSNNVTSTTKARTQFNSLSSADSILCPLTRNSDIGLHSGDVAIKPLAYMVF